MRTTVVVASMLALALACKDSSSPERPLIITELAFPASNQFLQVPRTLQLSTRDGGAVTWASSDESVATVSGSGLITARFPGATTITARRGALSATMLLTVTASRIEIAPDRVAIALGGSQLLTATVRDANGAAMSAIPVAWTTENASIASVGRSTGLVTGVSSGSTTITATAAGVSGGVAVSVSVTLGARLTFGAIGTTANHACGLEAQTGFVYCWGDGHAGALGSGADGTYPATVSGGRHFRSISVGSYDSCAIEVQSALAYCWGSNADGELGDGSLTTRWEPTMVGGGRIRFSSVSAGGDVTCGIEDRSNVAYCWGKGGVIGDGSLSGRTTPTLVGGGDLHFTRISASDSHACAIEAQTDRLYCWGSNAFGQLGDGSLTDRLVPTLVGGGVKRFSSVDADYRMTCAIEAETGLGYCWGENNNGQVGDGTTTQRLVPTLVNGNLRFGSIDTGGQVSCGVEQLTDHGYCWGRNDLGQVGDGSTISRLLPTRVGAGGSNPRFSGISAALCCGTYGIESQTGYVYYWGYSTLNPTLLSPPLAPSVVR